MGHIFRNIMRGGYTIALACVLMIQLVACSIINKELSQTEISQQENWPEHPGEFKELAEKSVTTYHEQNRDYTKFLSDSGYDPLGDFLNWGRDNNYDTVPKDPNGIVTSTTETERYNPCTIAQYSLCLYGKYLNGEANKRAFLHQADFVLSMIEDDGSVRYYFDYPYYCLPDKYFKSGWCSAMDCGHLLSICARAYQLTGDKKYCNYAEKIIGFLQTPIEDDGVMATLEDLDPTLTSYVIFEEYPTKPATYTLNGFMYTLIGIYDWSCVESPTQDKAKELFDSGIRTLVKILPYYDIGGFTAYDLSHMTVGRDTPHIGVGYHREHNAFCKIFYDITGIEEFNHYYKLWASYVEE